MANLLQMCRYKAKMHVLSGLHGKMFITWRRLHVLLRIVIFFVGQGQTCISVKSTYLVEGNPRADVTVYPAMDN